MPALSQLYKILLQTQSLMFAEVHWNLENPLHSVQWVFKIPIMHFSKHQRLHRTVSAVGSYTVERKLALKKGACLDMGGGATLDPSSPPGLLCRGHSAKRILPVEKRNNISTCTGSAGSPLIYLVFATQLPGDRPVERIYQEKNETQDQRGCTKVFFAMIIQPKGFCPSKKVYSVGCLVI